MSDERVEVLEQPAPAALAEDRGGSALVTAIQFLTRISLPGGDHTSATALRRAPIYFPLVGALIGVVTAGVIGAASLIWPVWLAVILALAVEARLTGALHEDALADFCDAFGGGWTRDDVLRILKDSRVGSYGVLGLTLGVGLRAAATFTILLQVGPRHWLAWASAVVAASAIGRWMMVAAMIHVSPIPERASLSRDVAGELTGRDLLVATLWMLPFVAAFIVFFPLQAIFAAILLLIAFRWFTRLVVRRIGGMTGDCLGAIGYLSQVIVLLAATARWPA